MSDKYDRDGKPLGLMEWAAKLEDNDYKRVALTELPNGKRVSTVWLGLDHRMGDAGPPLIFETMVFDGESSSDLDMARYATEAEALAGHDAMVEKHR